MEIVGGGESLPLIARANKYIITIVDYFTRYAIVIAISYLSSETIINVFIDN